MKYFVIIVFLLLFSLELSASQEIRRIDSIVHDIVTLRKNYEIQLSNIQEKNRNLKEENRLCQEKIDNLENQIKKLKSTDKEKIIVKKVYKNENDFPKLKLKNKLIYFEASAFRFGNDALIYATANGNKVVAKWEKGTSFTSNVKSNKRIKITGYFINHLWRKADKKMWVNLYNVKKR
jgi:hypothetical protein